MSLRILIVDDSPVMRAHIKRVITASGLPIIKLRENEFNLIFSDYNMPNMAGDEFVAAVKLDPKLCEIPIIMVTTDNSTERVHKMSQLGCDGYICKPFNPETLKKKVLSIMG